MTVTIRCCFGYRESTITATRDGETVHVSETPGTAWTTTISEMVEYAEVCPRGRSALLCEAFGIEVPES